MTERMDAAVRQVAGLDKERMRGLLIFIDFWGLDSYEPPPAVMDDVRSIVRMMLAEAHRARSTPTQEAPDDQP